MYSGDELGLFVVEIESLNNIEDFTSIVSSSTKYTNQSVFNYNNNLT